jgi:hypothetical protein
MMRDRDMTTDTGLHIRSWRAGRAWASWHLFRGATDRPMCNAEVPDQVAWCELHESSAVLTLTDLCRRCLKSYAESEER